MLDSPILLEYMKRFYGYGNFKGGLWFIGMEEGGGRTQKNVASRLEAWNARGKKQLEDLVIFHELLETLSLWTTRPRLQRTWAQLIRLMLTAMGLPDTLAELRDFQRTNLGRLTSDHCLLELLPLPSPSTDKWHYSRWSDLAFLSSRHEYRSHLLQLRIDELKRILIRERPRAVVFYGVKYRDSWEQVAQCDLRPSHVNGICTGRRRRSRFLMLRHPTSRGITNEYFKQAGRLVASLLS